MSRITNLMIVAIVAIVTCGTTSAGHAAPSKAALATPKPAVATPADLVIGEYKLTKVTDGDTIRVDGLDASLRLLGFDAEETFKSAADKRAFAAGWDKYKQDKRHGAARPVKFATPLGEQAKQFAIKFFDGVDTVRLERDHPAEIRDRYNRYLAYVLVNKNGTWVNYNIEAVRAGMAPYFPKYGRSRRFHQEFLDAEAEAKHKQLGIWAPAAEAYPDYPEREAWWAARGDFVETFRKASETHANYIDLTHADALTELENAVGKEVVVIGTVGELRGSEHGPTRVLLSRQMGSDFPLVFFDKAALAASGVAGWIGEFIVVTGVPSIYDNPRTHTKQLEIVVKHASQVELSPVPGLTQDATP